MTDNPQPRWKLAHCLGGQLMIAVLTSTGCAGLSEINQAAHVPLDTCHVPGTIIPPQPMTLPRFLGVDFCARRAVLVGRAMRDRGAALVPALEPKPLPLPIDHPANATSPSPTVAAAHKVQKAKAAKAAKMKAIAVLAGEGCAADPLIEEGLLAALDDPAAEVRIAAIQAVIQSTRGCDGRCGDCCSLPIRAKLTRMVFEKSSPCCWFEPDSKARRLARLALDACGGPVDPASCGCATGIENDVPIELPDAAIIQEIMVSPQP